MVYNYVQSRDVPDFNLSNELQFCISFCSNTLLQEEELRNSLISGLNIRK